MSAARCACGCGQSPDGKRKYVNGAHKQRAYRQRKRALANTPCTASCPWLGYCKRHERFNRPARPVKEEAGAGGKRVRYWDPDHAGKPGSWEQFWDSRARSARPAVPRFERSSNWVPACRSGRVDEINHFPGPLDADIYTSSGRQGPAAAAEFERWLDTETPTVYRIGLEALRRAVAIEGKPLRRGGRHRKFSVDVVDGWATISQAASLEVVEFPDTTTPDLGDELEEAA